MMKYICLGDIEPGKFPEMTEEQQQAMLDECFECESKERRGKLVLEARGLNHAIQLISQHPGEYGPWEI